MFDELEAAISRVAVSPHGEAIAEARRLRDLLDARIARAEADYAAAHRHEVEGYGSMVAFERHRNRLTLHESRNLARRAGRLAAWPEVGRAWADGRLTRTHVELAVVTVPERHVARFARHVEETIEVLAPLTPLQAVRALRHWVQLADAHAEREAVEAGRQPRPRDVERELSASRTVDGVLVLDGSLDADSAAFVERALAAATRPDSPTERRSPRQRRADALVEVCRRYLDAPSGGATSPSEGLTVVADITTLYRAALRGAGVRTAAELDRFLDRHPMGELEQGLFLDAFDGRSDTARTLDGNPVSDGLLSLVADGGGLERLLTAGGRVIDHGRRVRLATGAQRRAAAARDQGCRVEGCDQPLDRCDLHHVVPWEAGGPTSLDNLVHKCRHEHLRHHREGWTERLEPDGTYTVRSPSGAVRSTSPPGTAEPVRLPVWTSSAPPTPRPPAPHPCEHCSPSPEQRRRFEEDRRLTLERARRELGLGA